MHLLISDYLKKQKQSTFIYFPSIKYSLISMCALVSQLNLSLTCQPGFRSMEKSTNAAVSVMVLPSVPWVTFWVLLGYAILRHHLSFSEIL